MVDLNVVLITCLQTWTSTDCSGNVDYTSGLSTQCGTCFQINPLMNFFIQNTQVTWHGISGPPSPSSLARALPLDPSINAMLLAAGPANTTLPLAPFAGKTAESEGHMSL